MAPIIGPNTIVEQDLLIHVLEHTPDLATFRARDIFSPVRTDGIVGGFPKIQRERIMAEQQTLSADGASFKRFTLSAEEHTYRVQYFGLEGAFNPVDRERFRPVGFGPEQMGAIALRQLRLAEEQAAADKTINDATTFPLSGDTGLDVVNEWDDAANATPISDVQVGVDAIWSKTGISPQNMQLVLHWKTVRDVMGTQEFLDRHATVGRAFDLVNPDLSVLASTLGVGRVLMVGAPKNAAQEGLALSVADVWDPSFAFLHAFAEGADLTQPRFGATFFNEAIGGLEQLLRWVADPDTEMVAARQAIDQNVVDAAHGFRFGDLVT